MTRPHVAIPLSTLAFTVLLAAPLHAATLPLSFTLKSWLPLTT